jgi:putative endonuclease
LILGSSGEEQAVGLLQANGYKIIVRNYRSRFGEIDIIASESGTTCFVEVKTRQGDRFGLPQEAVTLSKKRHLSRAALVFLKENNLLEKPARFDVVSIDSTTGSAKTELIKNAFDLDIGF